MMIVAGCAVLFNIILGFVLHGVCKLPHSHGHSHNHAHNSRGSHESSTEHTQLSLRNDDLQSDSENDDNDEFEDCRNEKKLVCKKVQVKLMYQCLARAPYSKYFSKILILYYFLLIGGQPTAHQYKSCHHTCSWRFDPICGRINIIYYHKV